MTAIGWFEHAEWISFKTFSFPIVYVAIATSVFMLESELTARRFGEVCDGADVVDWQSSASFEATSWAMADVTAS